MVLGLKEGLVACATLCIKSEVILATRYSIIILLLSLNATYFLKDNIRRNVSYKWKVPSHKNKFGDKAEEATMKFLGRKKFCKLLGEPIYLISGILV